MKIAFIHNAFTSYRISLFNEIAKHYKIDFFFHTIYGHSKIKANFNFKILRSLRIPFIDSDYTFAPFLFLPLIKNKYQIFIGAGFGSIDTLTTFFVAKLLRKPFILWDVSWYVSRSFLTLFRFPICRYMALHSDVIIVPGYRSKEFYISMGVSNKIIFRSPNVSFLRMNNNIMNISREFKKSLQINDDEKIILFFGRLMNVKGIEYLIKAYLYLQKQINLRLIIASSFPGEKQYELKIKKLIDNLQLKKVNLLFLNSEEEKAAIFLISDIFVLPSIFSKNGPETWGMVLNEAMSIGKPVIATNAVGGAYDLIKNGLNGFIVREKDENALAEKIKYIVSNDELMKNMGNMSMKIINDKFTENCSMQGFMKAISLLKNGNI